MDGDRDEAVVESRLSAGDLLKQSWEFFKRRWDSLVVISFLPLGAIFLFAMFWMLIGVLVLIIGGIGVGMGSFGDVTFWQSLIDKAPALIAVGAVWLLVLVLAILFLAVWGTAAMIVYLDNPEAGVKQAIERARSKAMPLIVFGIISGLITVFGYILLIIPGILFSLWFGLGQYAVVLEGKGPIEALGVSKKYVQSNFWWFVGKVLIWIIISMAVVFGAEIFLEKLSFLISFITGMIGQVYMYLVYRQMRRAELAR